MNEKRKRRILALLRRHMALNGYDSAAALARALNAPVKTMQRRMAEPDKLTMAELDRLVRFLKIPACEIGEVWTA